MRLLQIVLILIVCCLFNLFTIESTKAQNSAGTISFPPTWDKKTEKEIKELLNSQTDAINKSDASMLLKGFWKSDSTTLVVKDGIADGYKKLESYQKYEFEQASKKDAKDKFIMTYEILKVEQWSPTQVFFIGKGILTPSLNPEKNPPRTYTFSLIIEKKQNKWVITNETISI